MYIVIVIDSDGAIWSEKFETLSGANEVRTWLANQLGAVQVTVVRDHYTSPLDTPAPVKMLKGHSCRIGDVVTLKSGGPEMTITGLHPDGDVIATWWHEKSVARETAFFAPQALAFSDGTKLARLREAASAAETEQNSRWIGAVLAAVAHQQMARHPSGPAPSSSPAPSFSSSSE